MNCIKDGKYTGDSCFGCKIKADDCEIRDKVYRNRWIPVNEKLPENKQVVLVTHRTGSVGFGFCNINSGNQWRDGEGYLMATEPIVWQPLPEPYKTVEE